MINSRPRSIGTNESTSSLTDTRGIPGASISAGNLCFPDRRPRRSSPNRISTVIELCKHRGYKYAVSMVDRRTKWVEVAPIKNIEAQTVARVRYVSM